ncbi:MAG: TadE/TadG family type IV pilus assembly protein [Thermoanaerobaculia bacterium]
MATSFFNRLRRDTRGQSVAEFALAAPVLILLLIGIVEFSRHYYARLGIRQAVAQAARFHATGQSHPDPDDPGGGSFDDRADSIKHTIETRAAELGLDVTGIDVSTLGADGNPVPGSGAGAEGDVVRIQADLSFHFLALSILDPDGALNFTVVTTYKNEPRF